MKNIQYFVAIYTILKHSFLREVHNILEDPKTLLIDKAVSRGIFSTQQFLQEGRMQRADCKLDSRVSMRQLLQLLQWGRCLWIPHTPAYIDNPKCSLFHHTRLVFLWSTVGSPQIDLNIVFLEKVTTFTEKHPPLTP